jgi:hypothetical protein
MQKLVSNEGLQVAKAGKKRSAYATLKKQKPEQ